MDCHEYQRRQCELLNLANLDKILNVGCKEDPAGLGKLFNATNLDKYDFDPHTGIHGKDVQNFVQGDAKDLPWQEPTFHGVVIGEVLEHCTKPVAEKILSEAKRVLLPSGKVILTFPLDGRPPEAQHAKHLLVEWDEGITSWHQTIWSDADFFQLLEDVGLVLESRTALEYSFLNPQHLQGYGCVLVAKD